MATQNPTDNRLRGQPGHCRQCGAVVTGGASRCEPCRERRIVLSRERAERLYAEGRCVSCAGPRVGDFRLCAACRKKSLRNADRLTQERKAAGLCTYCGEPSDGHIRCAVCRDRENKQRCARYAETPRWCRTCGAGPLKAKRQFCRRCLRDRRNADAAEWRKRMVAEGRCPNCCKANDRPDHSFCSRCQLKIRERNGRVKRRCIDAYGGCCQCCGETELDFLTIDHIANDGNVRRKSGVYPGQGCGQHIYAFLARQAFPQGIHQTLCFNCQISKRIRGTCIHQLKKNAPPPPT